tara:strand:- start:106 stop:531 length:426 start_codon:yes stop_codon:yes gene_type:complete
MKLSEIKESLLTLDEIHFKLPNGTSVPPHFHVTEVGKVSKHFIDCGGQVRKEATVNFQLWEADDYVHRLHPQDLLEIISLAENALEIENLNIEVEYQEDTIGKYGLSFNGQHFLLTKKSTDCLDQKNAASLSQSLKLKSLS